MSTTGKERVSIASAVRLPLIGAKTSRPQMRDSRVHRHRLDKLLDAAVQQPVTLVCAGAGWGKTMAVSGWAQRRHPPVAWLNADRHDNDPQVFWAYLLAALRVADAVPAGNPLAGLGSVPADELERTTRLAVGLAQLPAGTVLVIDDVQEIDDPDLLRELFDLLRRAPAGLRLVLVGRVEPPLGLHRLRAAGLLAEIRTEQLAFGADEAREILGRHGLRPGASDLTTLLQRTEGWATGLQLAAAFLTGQGGARTITDFAGDVRGVEDYLVEEVLAHCTGRERRFLLQTSICENLNAGLAETLTEQPDSQHILEELEHHNDFVVRLGPKPLWFRYHHLLRDVLGHRLALEAPTAVAGLHRRAARWHAANDSVLEALTHAVSAPDWPYVGRLVTRHAGPLMVSTHRPALVKVLQQVPTEVLGTTPELMICAALLLFHAGDYDAIPARLDAARSLVRGSSAADREPVEMMAGNLQLAADRAVGDMPALVAGATRLLELLATTRFAAPSAVAQSRAIALNNRGVGLLWTGKVDDAERELWAASGAARVAGVELTELNATGHLALLQVLFGSVHEAAQLATGAADLAARRGWRYTLQAVAAHLAQALVRLEWYELDGADQALEAGLRAHRSDPEAALRHVILGVQARLVAARGDIAAARHLLEESCGGRRERLRMPAVDRWIRRTESAVDLAAGRPDRVERRYATTGPEADGYAERLLRARAAYAEGDHRRAEELIARLPGAERDTVARTEAGVLRSLLAEARGRSAPATEYLSAAVTLAAREGIRRPFVVLSDARLDGLLDRLQLVDAQAEALVADLRIPRGDGPVDKLSQRETEILRYLATMLTAAEIGGQLNISVNTVKAHMRAIYRKLGAARRTEAVTLARRSGLL